MKSKKQGFDSLKQFSNFNSQAISIQDQQHDHFIKRVKGIETIFDTLKNKSKFSN